MQKPKHGILVLQSTLFWFLILNSSKQIVQAQSLPPAKPDGFAYKNHPVDSKTILIEAFFDPVCPDSRDAWSPLKEALAFYGHRVSLLVHLLPLPYHDNAFAVSRALHIVNMLNSNSTFDLLECLFEHQERFYNAPTHYMSRAAVVDEIVKLAGKIVGNHQAIESGFSDRRTDLATRVSFKYSASRGVSGTPTFFVNGFVLPDAGSPLDIKGWKTIINPLVRQSKKARVHDREREDPHFFL